MYIVNKIIACCRAIKDFFVKPSKATRSQIGALDAVEIIVALMPLVIFGCLVFELSALCVLAISLFLNVALDFLWNIIFKKPKIFNCFILFVFLLIYQVFQLHILCIPMLQ